MVIPASPAVTFNELVIDNETEDPAGTLWLFVSLLGWWDSAPVRVETQEIQPAGEVVTAARKNGRPLVLTAMATSPTPNSTKLGKSAIYTAIDTANIVGNCLLVPRLLTVAEPDKTLHAMVRRNGSQGTLKTAILGEAHSLRVEWQLFAPDPNRYDEDDVAVVD